MLNQETHELNISLLRTYQRGMRRGLPDLSTTSIKNRSRVTEVQKDRALEGLMAKGTEGHRDIRPQG